MLEGPSRKRRPLFVVLMLCSFLSVADPLRAGNRIATVWNGPTEDDRFCLDALISVRGERLFHLSKRWRVPFLGTEE